MDIIRAKDKQKNWGLNFCAIMQLWRGGCIIQADYITNLIDKLYRSHGHDKEDLLANSEGGKELAANFAATKETLLRGVQADAFVPSLSQSVEYYKYMTSTKLPTQFMESQLDYFGQHMFDTQSDPVGGREKGNHHFQWHPARGITGE
ncbi:6-phosphogluconate dehydrogenase [Microdochium trichocladiopsis]|uniref:phosphogluconate dehydrogenase (NADP(+)-dependent, decarboxylating) n=1 Tax=Microdochium trichocladiopsis TaxID=1682393 RepID=A0A9P9BPZ2_9PEZI|nr:6-phosphogluconate dehydrogenase [Microdochium trichocladiopsis]KAH7029650.1 6-phosphogluconate dehydrogenase [Microdochium trichocladiopsis]